MTKTLTEQWREGTLESGWYYVKDINNKIYIAQHYTYGPSICLYEEDILSPVPSYDEYCNLVFQANKPKNPLSDVMMCYDTEREKKVVERLQEQLKEANEILMMPDNIKYHDEVVEMLNNYMEKWGVK